jgi:hypothetical protein
MCERLKDAWLFIIVKRRPLVKEQIMVIVFIDELSESIQQCGLKIKIQTTKVNASLQ